MSEQHPDQESAVRVNKFLSEAGFCSRRDADKLIDQGLITINDQPIEMGTKVLPGDQVKVRGELVNTKPKRIYLALNKPPGITCTTARNVDDNIVDFINYPERIFPIGRLDKPSEGLILLTNDGDIVNKILRAGNNHEKEYLVTVDKPITDRFIKQMAGGVPILDTVTNKCKVTQTSQFGFEIILTQGLNRQIRRMCEHLGYRVRKLKRVRIMNLTVDNIGIGQWRHLTEVEMDNLNLLIADSSKTKEASELTPMQLAELTPEQRQARLKRQTKPRSEDTAWSRDKAKSANRSKPQNRAKPVDRDPRQSKDGSEENVWSRNKTRSDDRSKSNNRAKPVDREQRQSKERPEENVWSRNKTRSDDRSKSQNRAKPVDKEQRQNKERSEENAWSRNKTRSEDRSQSQNRAKPADREQRRNREKTEENTKNRDKSKQTDRSPRQNRAKPEDRKRPKSRAKPEGKAKRSDRTPPERKPRVQGTLKLKRS